MENPNQTYASLTIAYDFMNKELFVGELPLCLITMQRHKGALGYFSEERFKNTTSEEITDDDA